MKLSNFIVALQLGGLTCLAACSPYPSKAEITSIFANLSSTEGYLTFLCGSVAPDVKWTLTGTHQLAGVYTNRTIFFWDSVARLGSLLLTNATSSLTLSEPVIGGGDEEWSVQQLHALGVFRNGMIYDNRFSWATKWNRQKKIIAVNTYFDSAMVLQAISSLESPVYNSLSQRNTIVTGPTTFVPASIVTDPCKQFPAQ